jgi:hypothetical protein
VRPVALGWKTHSGWAALVVIAADEKTILVLDRRRVELVDPADVYWAKQPYHAAEGLDREDAHDVVKRAITAAHRSAVRELRAALARAREADLAVTACGVVAGAPMPPWSVDEILAVHFRMHKAEGVLWSDALLHAAEVCALPRTALRDPKTPDRIARLGRQIGPPWGADQKQAAHAALAALAALRADATR